MNTRTATGRFSPKEPNIQGQGYIAQDTLEQGSEFAGLNSAHFGSGRANIPGITLISSSIMTSICDSLEKSQYNANPDGNREHNNAVIQLMKSFERGGDRFCLQEVAAYCILKMRELENSQKEVEELHEAELCTQQEEIELKLQKARSRRR